MKKYVVVPGLLLSIVRMSYAQKIAADDRLFDLPPYTITFKTWADLGHGNSMRLEVTSREDLRRFQNIDSLLLVFFNDIKALQDSLADPQTAKRIDYLMDAGGYKKLRIRQSRPAANTYLLGDGEPALLRLQQDTVFLLLPVPPDKAGRSVQRYDRLGFFLNRYEELNGLITTGLNQKIVLMQTNNSGWTTKKGRDYLDADPTISGRAFPSAGHGTQLELRYHVSMQNYKSYFTPSFSLGATITFNNQGTKNAFSADWEPVFLFAHDAQGRLQTYRNDFLVLGYSNRKAEPPGRKVKIGDAEISSQNALNLDLDFSLGYLIYSEGGYVARHTFRLCVGSASLAGNRIVVQPCMYFNDLFKGVTPGVRVSF
jgi:hypothetical protein